MKTKLLFFSCIFAVAATVALSGWSFVAGVNAAEKFVTIGTGGVTGVYYPAGGAICRLVNRKRSEHGIRCSVESTSGSIYNIEHVRDGSMEIGAVQADWQYNAHKGTDIFKDKGPFKDMRALFSLHTDIFTLIARSDSGISKLDDLKNKRVSIGEPGSGTRATMEVIMHMKNWTDKTFKIASQLKSSEQAQALCDNKIDAMLLVYGHPNGATQEVTTACRAKIIPISGPEVDKLIEAIPYYTKAIIPGGMYVGNPDDISSFGIKATFITSSKVSDDIVYQVVKAVFDNFDDFKTLHPVFSNLNKSSMVGDGLITPIHEGAIRYYKEKGLL